MSIILNNINFIYGMGSGQEKAALSEISLKIETGEFVGIVGHTGSGKSTLTHILNGLEKATSGEVYYNGQDIYDKNFSMKNLREKVGLVFQYPENQLFEVSVIKDVQFGPKNQGLSQLDVELRSFQALKTVGIPDNLLDVSPFTLSGGQKRKVAIAGVLAMEPEVLILDEPTAGLDPKGRDEILDMLKILHQEKKITIILVSHSMEDIGKYVERILVMNQGKIVLDGEPSKIFQFEEELKAIQLDIPQSTKVLRALERGGATIPTSGVTPEESAEIITKWLQM